MSAVRGLGPDGEQQAKALTVLVPLKWWGSAYLTVVFNIVRFVKADAFFAKVQRLGAVYAMRWIIVQPFSGHSRAGRPADRTHHLLFETNYVGEWNEYLEGFGRILSPGLKAIFVATVGYPGVEAVEPFVAFARRHDLEPGHYYSAYGGWTPVQVQQALLVRRLGSMAAAADLPEFHQGGKIPLRRRQRRNHPAWLDLIVQVKPGQVDALRRTIARLGEDESGSGASPFEKAEHVHFARLVVVDHPSGSFLVFTATYDGGRRYHRRSLPFRARLRSRSLQILVAELLAAAGEELRPVFAHCVGYPSVLGASETDAEALSAFLVEHAVMHPLGGSLAYCAYPDSTVHEISEALRWTFIDQPVGSPDSGAPTAA